MAVPESLAFMLLTGNSPPMVRGAMVGGSAQEQWRRGWRAGEDTGPAPTGLVIVYGVCVHARGLVYVCARTRVEEKACVWLSTCAKVESTCVVCAHVLGVHACCGSVTGENQ